MTPFDAKDPESPPPRWWAGFGPPSEWAAMRNRIRRLEALAFPPMDRTAEQRLWDALFDPPKLPTGVEILSTLPPRRATPAEVDALRAAFLRDVGPDVASHSETGELLGFPQGDSE